MQDCDLNIKSLKGYTALHGAIISGGLKAIEKLVGCGADVNAQDNDGDSPLHLIRHSKAEEQVTDSTPEMIKVHVHILDKVYNIDVLCTCMYSIYNVCMYTVYVLALATSAHALSLAHMILRSFW